MRKPKLAVTSLDQAIADLVGQSDHRLLAIWAADCAARVLATFEEIYPADSRPSQAIEAGRAWARGALTMTAARQAAFAAHAAARDAKKGSAAAEAAARAAGHAAATAHVASHAIHAAIYAATTVREVTAAAEADAATTREREWQYHHLLTLSENQPH